MCMCEHPHESCAQRREKLKERIVCVCVCVCVRVRLIMLDRIKERKSLASSAIQDWLYPAVDNRNPAQPLAGARAERSISLCSPLSPPTFDFAVRGTKSSQVT